eukprot:GHVU01005957.1.p2 GENE.GHVU01005957.1~~GHVU01005957.1.p2  ORF type:complete len:170 (+),score=4.34 GHVU01005957.1:174-683(+)
MPQSLNHLERTHPPETRGNCGFLCVLARIDVGGFRRRCRRGESVSPSLPTGGAMVGLAPSYPPPTLVVADERRRDPVSSKYTLRVGFANLQKRIYGTAGSVGLTPPSNQQALLSRIRAAVGYKISLGCARVRDPPQRNVINVTLMFATPWALAWATLSPPGIGNSHVCL